MPGNLKQQSKKAVYESKVNSLDSLGTDIEDVIMNEGLSVLEKIAGDFVERVHQNINNQHDFVVSGSISNLEMKFEDSTLNIYAPAHLVYQSRGVSGTEIKYDTPHSYTNKMPPVEVIKQWIKDKKLILTERNSYHKKYDNRLSEGQRNQPPAFKEQNTESKINSAAYAIAKKIQREGIKPKNLYEREIPKLIEDIQSEFSDFVIQQISQNIAGGLNPKGGGGNRIIPK